MSDSVQPRKWQPTRLPHPSESPDKNTGVGCHFLLQCIKVKSESEVSHSCQFCATPWTAACQASLSITNSHSPHKPMSIESAIPSNHLIFCCPLLLLPSISPSITVFSNESALHIRWPKYWSFSFNICPSNEHPGLISFRMNWLLTLSNHYHHHFEQMCYSWVCFFSLWEESPFCLSSYRKYCNLNVAQGAKE